MSVACIRCGQPLDAAGPAVGLDGVAGRPGPSIVPFLDEVTEPGDGGFEHLDCFVAVYGTGALIDLLHEPKARQQRPG